MSNYVSISALADMGFKGDRIPGVGCSPNVHKTFEGFHISYRGDDGGYGGPTPTVRSSTSSHAQMGSTAA